MLAVRIEIMDIHLDTNYYNCSLSFVDTRLNKNGYFECDLIFNSGWLSCKQHSIFSRNNVRRFVENMKLLNEPFEIIAILESIKKNIQLKIECTAKDNILIGGELFEDSEFDQQAKLGFNIKQEKLNTFIRHMDELLAKNS